MDETRGAKLSEIIKQLGIVDAGPNPDPSIINSSGVIKPSQKLVNLHRISARGKGLKFVPVKRPVTFALRAPGYDQDDLSITVTAPSGREVPTRVDTIRPGVYEVEYITPEVGDHVIEVSACNSAITGSPFHSSAYDASKIKVAPMPSGLVGHPVEFEIDGSEAGSGNLEILVNGGRVTSEVKCLGNHRFVASFVPHTATAHIVEMKFNEEPVPGSPWECNIVASTDAPTTNGAVLRVQTLENFPVSQTQFFDVVALHHSKEQLVISILGPGKVPVQHRIVDLQNDTYRVYFTASVVGSYSFEVVLITDPSSAATFVAKAFDISRIHVSEIPKSCLLNTNCEFQVDASQAGEGQLEIAVNDGEVPNQVQVQGNGRCQVSFRPEYCNPHVVDIKFNGLNVPGCPFTVQVSDATQFTVDLSQLELIAVGRICKFHIESKTGVQPETIRVVINSPSGRQVPVNLTYHETVCSCEFNPSEVGPHVMTIEHRGRSISATPFFIKTYDAQKVMVTSASYGCVGKPVQFVVDAGASGEGNLEISVNAKGLNVMTQVHPMGGAKFGVSFTPNEVCEHIVYVTFNNEPVPGSPFTVTVGADMEKISVSGTAVNFAPVEQNAIITVHNIVNERDLFVKVESPTGCTIPATLKQELHSTNVTIEFFPREPGEHQIHLKYRGTSLPGSPFSSKVYDIRQIGVKEMPSEIIAGKPVTFLVEAANAGPGNLEVIVNNGKVPSSPQALGPSLYAISFLPKDSETHFIEIKFNGEPIPGSPFICNVVDAAKMSVKKDGLDRIPVNVPASFVVDTNGVSFIESAISILGPLGKSIKPTVVGDPSTGFKASFTPTDVGDHLIDVKVAGVSVPSCPFMVKVYDSKNVKISDITTGHVSKPVFFSIDASQAGAGNLEIIVSVNGRNVPNYVQSEGNAKFKVNFKPTEANVHLVSVKFNGEPVPGSPYSVRIVDSNQVVRNSLSSLKSASLTKKIEFSVENKKDAKECSVIITSASGKKLKPVITEAIDAFNVAFAPAEVGPHQIQVFLDGQSISKTPFVCNVYDVSRVKISGLKVGRVGKPMTFQVDASQAGEGTLELVVQTEKTSVRAEVLMRSRGMYDVTFVPQEKMFHFLDIQFNEENVPGSPFEIEVRGAETVNGITPSSHLPSSPSQSRTKAAPLSAGKSNGEVKNHTRIGEDGFGVKSYPRIGEDGFSVKNAAVGLAGTPNISTFEWPIPLHETSKVEVKVTGPNGSVIPSSGKLESGYLEIGYTPHEVGLYKIEAFNSGSLVSSKPFLVEVCDPTRVKVTHLEDGVVGREQLFKVDATKAGKGNMTISIRVKDEPVDHSIHEISPGVQTVSFVPRKDQVHSVDIKFNGYSIQGYPKLIQIRDPTHSIIIHGPALKSCIPGLPSSFVIETGGFAAAKDFDVIITDPLGSPLPVKCYQQKDGSLMAEFVPQNVATHKIEVLYLDSPVSGSPFTSEAFDASKVTLQKIRSNVFAVNEKVTLSLSRRDAGYAELDVTVTSPLGRHLPIEVVGNEEGDGEKIEFVPSVSGKYKIAITYGGVEIPGSPLTFLAQDLNLPKVEGCGLKFGFKDHPAHFTIDAKELKGVPGVRVSGPEQECPLEITEDSGCFHVTYIPKEVGVFDVGVAWDGHDIPGSPFHPQIVDLSKVKPVEGWNKLLDESKKLAIPLNVEKVIIFETIEAGPGQLRCTVRGPNGEPEEAKVDLVSPHKFQLSFTPKVPGEHLLSLYFGDHLLPRSPITSYTPGHPSTNGHGLTESATVVLRGHGLAGARVGEETEFVIDGNETGNGQPHVTLSGVKSDIPVKISRISQRVFKATYTPTVPGVYLLNVLWAGKQVKGCPLKVSIRPRCDASRVLCSGEGLKGGGLGEKLKVFIDTKRAGPGELSAHCSGPHKVAHCELIDQLDGTFFLFLKPQEGGKHMLTVKYGGEHVNGSPFAIKVVGAPDPSKVRVYGPGIEHGVLPLYQSRFICDTRGAGAGQLTVRIRGPKGAFRVEMQRESQKDRTILCKYDPTEPGDYRIEVKWSGENVPGSPFSVLIFDTQDELNRFLQSQSRNTKHVPPPGSDIAYLSNPSMDHYFGPVTSKQYSTGFGQMSWRGSNHHI